MVQLDHMSRGRAIFGSGPGALPSDARTHGIDPMLLRDRQDEALGVIIRLLRGDDRFDYECDWFELHDAQLQLLPVQEEMEMAVGVVDLAVGDAAGRQVRHRRAVDRLELDGGHQRPADPVGLRRGGGGEARLDGAAARTGGC